MDAITDPTVLAAIIGAVGAIIVAAIGLVKLRQRPSNEDKTQEAFQKAKSFRLGYIVAELEFYISVRKIATESVELFAERIEQAAERCAVLAQAAGLQLPESPEQYIEALEVQIESKSISTRNYFELGRIVGDGYGAADLVKLETFVPESTQAVLVYTDRLSNLTSILKLPRNLFSLVKQDWQNVIRQPQQGQDQKSRSMYDREDTIKRIVHFIETQN